MLEAILRDGGYRSQFETRTSNDPAEVPVRVELQRNPRPTVHRPARRP
ncbi:MAG TPA: hypothetical protein VGG75_12165 [Trebonia sp.]